MMQRCAAAATAAAQTRRFALTQSRLNVSGGHVGALPMVASAAIGARSLSMALPRCRATSTAAAAAAAASPAAVRPLHTHAALLKKQKHHHHKHPPRGGSEAPKQRQLNGEERDRESRRSRRRVWVGVRNVTLSAAAVGAATSAWLALKDEEERSAWLLVWKLLPLRFLSHVWGTIHRWELPVPLRKPLYMAWTRAFDCQLDEIAGGAGEAALPLFPNLNSFFIRHIDLARCRPLDDSEMVSPVDGRVNVFGEVAPGGLVQQIKGMDYRVEDLLGHSLPAPRPGSKLFYYVLYLAPGDYHRMHSPAECVIAERRHFPGALYPVAPSIAKWIPSLFVRNERVVLTGEWAHGFFAMVPVGAYNVGSMKLTFDRELDTNLRAHTVTHYTPSLADGLKARPFYRTYRQEVGKRVVNDDEMGSVKQEVQAAAKEFVSSERQLLHADDAAGACVASATAHPVHRVSAAGVHLSKGDEFSRFELGSTIVVVFEVDKDQTFNWNIEEGQKIKLGQSLGLLLPNKHTQTRAA